MTAIATVVLAAVAIRTMRDTRRTIEATETQAELAARAFALQLEPHLIPYDGQPTVGDIENIGLPFSQVWVVPLFVTLVNIGNGVAHIESVEASAMSGGRPHRIVPSPVAQPGKLTSVRLDFMVPPPGDILTTRDPFLPGDGVSVAVRYRGVADTTSRELQFRWQMLAGALWKLDLD